MSKYSRSMHMYRCVFPPTAVTTDCNFTPRARHCIDGHTIGLGGQQEGIVLACGSRPNIKGRDGNVAGGLQLADHKVGPRRDPREL